MALSKVGRGALVVALVGGGFCLAVGALLIWDNPSRTPKHPSFTAALQFAGALGLFGVCLTALPVASGAGPARDREPPPGPSPVPARWHRVVLTQRLPGVVVFHTPGACPSCGDHEVGWTMPIASRERSGGAGFLLSAGGGVVGQLVARSLVQRDQVTVNACDPCFQLDASRLTSKVVLAGAWFSASLIALVSALFGDAQLEQTLVAVATLAASALLLHVLRFRGRRARETSIACGLGVRAKLAKASWFALSDRGVRWSLLVDACDPTWALALIAENAATCDVRADEAALEAHAAELRVAELR